MPIEPDPCAWALPAREQRGAGRRGRARRRPRAGDAPRRLPRRALPHAGARGAGHGLVEPGPARGHPARRLPPLALAAAHAAGATRSRSTAPSAPVVAGCADPARPGALDHARGARRLHRPARARLGALRRGLGRGRHARRGALRRGDRRALRRRVEVPRAARTRPRPRSRGSWSGSARRGGPRLLDVQWTTAAPADARARSTSRAGSTCARLAAALPLPPALG